MRTPRAQRVQPRGYPSATLGPGLVEVLMLPQARYTSIVQNRRNAGIMSKKQGHHENQRQKLGL